MKDEDFLNQKAAKMTILELQSAIKIKEKQEKKILKSEEELLKKEKVFKSPLCCSLPMSLKASYWSGASIYVFQCLKCYRIKEIYFKRKR